VDSRTTPALVLVIDREVSQRRKSVTGLPRDPQLSAFGEVRFGVDVEPLTPPIHRTRSFLGPS